MTTKAQEYKNRIEKEAPDVIKDADEFHHICMQADEEAQSREYKAVHCGETIRKFSDGSTLVIHTDEITKKETITAS